MAVICDFQFLMSEMRFIFAKCVVISGSVEIQASFISIYTVQQYLMIATHNTVVKISLVTVSCNLLALDSSG